MEEEPSNSMQPSEHENHRKTSDKTMADADAPSNSSSSESEKSGSAESDSDSDSEDEALLNLQLQNLESELAANPSNYDSHVQYIRLLRKMGEVEKLRQARETMNSVFPLSPALWQEWAKDEASLSTRPDAVSSIEKLYERGVFEYLSIPLWCDYLNFVQGHDPTVRQCSAEGISKARDLFERATTAAGLHAAEGSKIWDAYRKFEQAILLTLSETGSEVREKQLQRIRSIFHRQLSVPLADLRDKFLAYKGWELEQGNLLNAESDDIDGIPSNVASAYQKALGMYSDRAQFEEQISRKDISEEEKFQHFLSYLKFEQSSGDPVRVQILYERAVSEFPVSTDLWVDYTRYMDKTLKASSLVKNVYSRATRNCPWVGKLWVGYLICLERSHASEEEMSVVFGKSLQCTFSTLEEYLDLYHTRIDSLRRKIVSAPEECNSVDFSVVREVFQQASEYLAPHLSNTNSLLQLYDYWAFLELKLGKDFTAARGVWERLLKNSGLMLEAWQQYISMEISLEHIPEARSIYKRCYTKKFGGTGAEDICNAWLNFERRYGTLENYEHALQKVTPRLEELRLLRQQQEAKQFGVTTYETGHTVKQTVTEKRKSRPVTIDKPSPAKRRKTKSQNPIERDEPNNAKIPIEKDEFNNMQQNVAKVNDGKENNAKAKNAANERKIKGFNTGKSERYTDQCTVFISNLDLKATSEDVRQFFSDIGGVSSIRILRDRDTRVSRGLAYVDFEDEEHLAAAIAKNRQKLLTRLLSIRKSDPSKSKQKAAPGEHVGDSHKTESDGRDTSKERKSEPAAPRRGKSIQLGNTSFVPRNVKPLGWTSGKPKPEEGDERPKSNDEFRNLLIKKEDGARWNFSWA